MKQVYIHLGAHKTASTLIQHTLLRPGHLIAANGEPPALISIHNPDHGFAAFRLPYLHMRNEMMWLKSKGTNIPESLIDRMAAHLERYIKDIPANHIVISDENLLGNTLGHPTGLIKDVQGGLYPVSEEISRAFERVAAVCSVHFRLYIRDTESLIASSYNDWISKLRSAISLEDFARQLDGSALNWEHVLDPWKKRYQDAFDHRDFQGVEDDQVAYLREFAQWCRLEIAPGVKLDAKMRVNKSLSARQLAIAVLLIPHLKDTERDAAREFLRQLDR